MTPQQQQQQQHDNDDNKTNFALFCLCERPKQCVVDACFSDESHAHFGSTLMNDEWRYLNNELTCCNLQDKEQTSKQTGWETSNVHRRLTYNEQANLGSETCRFWFKFHLNFNPFNLQPFRIVRLAANNLNKIAQPKRKWLIVSQLVRFRFNFKLDSISSEKDNKQIKEI